MILSLLHFLYKSLAALNRETFYQVFEGVPTFDIAKSQFDAGINVHRADNSGARTGGIQPLQRGARNSIQALAVFLPGRANLSAVPAPAFAVPGAVTAILLALLKGV